jgi:uncharacterized protein involved in exopolysaccharide biosynthesis
MDGLLENFRIALHQVWQRRWLALAVAWVIAAVGWAAISFIPNSYEAKAKLFAQVQQVLPSEAAVGGAPDQQSNMLRLKQTLTSNENLTRVVRRTELNALATDDAALGATVAALREKIKITALPDNLFEISATANFGGLSNAQNARASAAVVQQLVDLFVGDGGTAEQTNQSLAFLDEELRRREQQLQAAEQRRVEFEQRNLGVVPGAGSAGDRMSSARAELAQLDQTIVTARSAIAAMQNQLQGTPATMPVPGGEASYGGPATSQLAGLQAQLSQYLGRGFTEQHPDVISIRSQIARLGPQAAQERSSGRAAPAGLPNPSHVSLRTWRSLASARRPNRAPRPNRRGSPATSTCCASNMTGCSPIASSCGCAATCRPRSARWPCGWSSRRGCRARRPAPIGRCSSAWSWPRRSAPVWPRRS